MASVPFAVRDPVVPVPYSTTARARRVDHVGMQRQPEVVVRPEHQRRPALDDDFAGPEHALDDGQARHGGSVRERLRHAVRRRAVCRADPSASLSYASASALSLGSSSPRQRRPPLLRRRALHLAARRPARPFRSARSRPRRRTGRTDRRCGAEPSRSATSADTVPLGSTTMTTRSARPAPAVPNATTRPRRTPARSSTAHSRSCGWYFRPFTMMTSFARPQTNSSPSDR